MCRKSNFTFLSKVTLPLGITVFISLSKIQQIIQNQLKSVSLTPSKTYDFSMILKGLYKNVPY